MESRIDNIEQKLDRLLNMVTIVCEQNETLISKQSDINHKLNIAIDDFGGEEMKDTLDKLKSVNIDSVNYLCNSINTYRNNGIVSAWRQVA